MRVYDDIDPRKTYTDPVNSRKEVERLMLGKSASGTDIDRLKNKYEAEIRLTE